MQPLAPQTTHKKRRNIYSDDSLDETIREKRRKIDLGGPSSFVNLQSHRANHDMTVIINKASKEHDETNAVDEKEVKNLLVVQIRKFKLKQSTERRSPDSKLLNLVNTFMNARKILQRDAAKEIPCSHSVLSAYRNLHLQNWNSFESKLLAWMYGKLDLISNYPFESTAEKDPLQIRSIEISSKSEDPTQIAYNIDATPVISGCNEDQVDDIQSTRGLLATSVITRLSTPNYL